MKDIDTVIENECYEGIRDQDGWECLEMTVREDHPKDADAILARLEATQAGGATDMTPTHYVHRDDLEDSSNAFDEPGEKATTHPWAAAARW